MFLIENVLKPLAKNVLKQLELPAKAWATNTAIHKKIFASGTTNLIIPNEKMNKIMKMKFKIKIKNEAKKERARFLRILVGTLPSKHSSWWWRTEDVLKTSWRSLQCNIFLSSKTSSRRLQDIVVRRLLEDVLKTSWRRGLANASLRGLLKTSWRHLEDILKTLWKRFWKTYCKYFLKTSSRRLERWKIITLKTTWKTRNICWIGAISLWNLSPGKSTIRVGEGTFKAVEDF